MQENKYYEFSGVTIPYYALIRSESKDKAIDIYNDLIADTNADFDDENDVQEVTLECVLEKWKEIDCDDVNCTYEEYKNDVINSTNCVLIADGSLI